MAFDKQRFDLLRQLRQEDNRWLRRTSLVNSVQRLQSSTPHGAERGIDEQVRVLDAAVDKQANLKAAPTELDATIMMRSNPRTGPGRHRWRTSCRLTGQRTQFGESEGRCEQMSVAQPLPV